MLELQLIEFTQQTSERNNGVGRVLKSFRILERLINNTAKASEELRTAVISLAYYFVRTYYTNSPSQPQLFSFTNNQLPVTLNPCYFKEQVFEFVRHFVPPWCLVSGVLWTRPVRGNCNQWCKQPQGHDCFLLLLHLIVHFYIDLYNLYAIYSQLRSVRFVVIYLVMNSKTEIYRVESYGNFWVVK